MSVSSSSGHIVNAMTVDVEDYFHVSAFADAIDRADWHDMPSRVVANTHRLLDLFDGQGVKSTFFVLGWVAEREPGLVREIVERGHELACHGYSHQLVYNQTPELFREETFRSKDLLEQAGQVPVRGYRAASYSITRRSQWALDILGEAGFEYDSSIFPVRHDRYGIPGAGRWPHEMTLNEGRRLVEFPLSTVRWAGMTLPMAGGGYFRLYPYALSRAGFRNINQGAGKPFVFYLHPWEVDPGQPRIKAKALSRFRHYNNLHRCESRLRRLLNDFRFAPMRDVLASMELVPGESSAPVGAATAQG
ncbi:polysaccharide deacetylase [Thioalkalivibrio sulfidiphilus HL-EbGr7]|uniref:Polysaccharide deacetylase n=1 Tax=Thioalkalivibrio sulfidiphilus (strain HL-EbGR7) TaxID=396588 RepID=B8GVC0_THISH|nr:XrtA system polysaccharide deacetylase [Thioalkalivibrio sulfidiphilus]ACL73466.1 polysaccharide deacetylase [Thioalkalivibrio sulfidiphilus HL-EbGr7]